MRRTGGYRAPRLLIGTALALALVATACGGDNETGENPSGSSSTTPTTASSSPAAPTGGETGGGMAGEPIKVGALFTMSGPTAAIGERSKSGADYWMQEHGSAFGDHPVELVVKDDGGTADSAITAVRELLDEEQVDFVIGPFLSGPTGGVLPLVNEAGLTQIVMSALPDAGDPSQYPNSFRIEYTKAVEGPGIVERIQALDATKVGALAVNNALGQSTIDALTEAIQASGSDLEIVDTETFESGATDVTAQVQALKDAGAEVIDMGIVASGDYINAIQAMIDLNLRVPVIGNSALGFPDIAAALPDDFLPLLNIGGYTCSMLRPVADDVAAFRTGLKAMLGVDTLDSTMWNYATAYDAMGILDAAVQATGGTDAAAIATYLQDNGYDGLKTTYQWTATDHNGMTVDDIAFGEVGSFEDGAHAPAEGACQG